MSLLLKTPDLQQIATDLILCYGTDSDNADFFDFDALVIDGSKLKNSFSAENLQALIAALTHCRLKPLAFRSGNAANDEVAQALGLVLAPAEETRKRVTSEAKNTIQTPVTVIQEMVKEIIREVPGPGTLVIDKPVRSGQKIYARGADLVVLAMVNQGGEVVADGNIHVYAPLRGKAMAGASGNTQARIFSICLEPELISIAGVYRTSENPLAPDIHGKAAQVRLSDDGQEKLLFEALNY